MRDTTRRRRTVGDWVRFKLGIPDRPGPQGPGSIEIGTRTYWGKWTYFRTFRPADRIVVGSYCSIADRVVVLSGGAHDTSALSTYPFRMLDEHPDATKEPQETQLVEIGHDVWIGSGSMIIGTIKIGTGSVIAAGSVVVNDVPPYSLVGGVPARVIRMRLSDADITKMLSIAWWNWDEQLIREAEGLLRGREVDALHDFAQERGLVPQTQKDTT